MPDALTRFMFEHAPVKGGIVQLHDVWKTVQGHANYPTSLKKALGELLAAAALLTSNIKFDGSLVLQIHGEGPVRLIVVEATSDKTLRATAKWEGQIADSASLADLVGNGRFVMTLDQSAAGKQNYQGIVPLEGNTIAEILSRYMQRSEQLDTRIHLACNEACAAGLLLQRLPGQSELDADAWNRASLLADTLKQNELLSLKPGDVLMRLFHEETLRRFDQEPLSFACACSRDKVGNMLIMLGEDEVRSILAERGTVESQCEFCGKFYQFDAVDVALLFSAGQSSETCSTRH